MIPTCKAVKQDALHDPNSFFHRSAADEDLLARSLRTKLKNEQAIFWEFGHELGVVDLPRERRAMIFKGPFDIVHMAAKSPMSDAVEPISVVE